MKFNWEPNDTSRQSTTVDDRDILESGSLDAAFDMVTDAIQGDGEMRLWADYDEDAIREQLRPLFDKPKKKSKR